MNKYILSLTFLLLMSNIASAQLWGDTIFVEDVYVDSGATYADVPVWLVINNPGICLYAVPLAWSSPFSGISPTYVYENAWPGCSDRYDSIFYDSPQMIWSWGQCENQLYHINVPFWTLHFTIDTGSPLQNVQIYKGGDSRFGYGLLATCDGMNAETLIVMPGHIYYGTRTNIDEPSPEPIIDAISNYPNPFGSSGTQIFFSLNKSDYVTVKIYNILGQNIKTFSNSFAYAPMSSGTHQISWNGTDAFGKKVPSGIYFYRVATLDGMVVTRKMVLLQ